MEVCGEVDGFYGLWIMDYGFSTPAMTSTCDTHQSLMKQMEEDFNGVRHN